MPVAAAYLGVADLSGLYDTLLALREAVRERSEVLKRMEALSRGRG